LGGDDHHHGLALLAALELPERLAHGVRGVTRRNLADDHVANLGAVGGVFAVEALLL
jgi:hypothetical protein